MINNITDKDESKTELKIESIFDKISQAKNDAENSLKKTFDMGK